MAKADAIRGPIALPKPTIDPRMPWYLPLSCNVTTSLTIIMVKLVIPPFATPARPLKMYNIVELTLSPHARSLRLSRSSADTRMFFLPNRSDNRPYKT